jgi:large subunit ribosomal protein L30
MAKAKEFKVKLVRSLIGATRQQRDAVRCLGLGRIGSQSIVKDGPAMRGQIFKVQHLLEVSKSN